MAKRNKKYTMRQISPKFSEKGGYSAHFIGDGYSIEGFTEILPEVIERNGIKVSEGVAKDLITKFLQACASKTVNSGETVTVGSLLRFNLSIRGWFANKDSKAAKENVRVCVRLLDDLKPTVDFSMSNVNEGDTLTLFTIRGEGKELGTVAKGAAATISGKYLQLIDGDTVTAKCGEDERTLEVVESAADHIKVLVPADLAGDEGDEVLFTVSGRCGDAEAGAQVKTIAGTLG